MQLIWHNEKRKINDLIPYDLNPRQLTEKQAKDLTKSLSRFGLVEIPAIDADGTIISGHQRCSILKQLNKGEEEIDVRVPNRKLTESEFKEYNLRSNKNTGEWDFNLLANFDEDLLIDIGFDENVLTELDGDCEEKLSQKKTEIIGYKKYHLLISVDMQKIIDVEEDINALIEKISKKDGIEIEQSAN